MRGLIRRHSLLAYFVLAFAGFWLCLPLRCVNWLLQFVGAFAPAVAALVVSGLSEGESSVRELVGRLGIWRVGPKWYLVVLGLPVAKALVAVGVGTLLGLATAARIAPPPPAVWGVVGVAFVFAAGEELGWRGYALPRLLNGRSALSASVILGAVHVAWHLPLILVPGQMLSDVPLLAYSTFVVAEAVLFTWIYQRTRGSVPMATLYHGMTNVTGFLYAGIDRAWMPWIRPSMSVLVALAVFLVTGPNLVRKRPGRGDAGPGSLEVG